MISIYSSISIETELVTHFSGYKIIKIPLKRVLHVLNHNFYFFTYRNITKFSKSIPSALVTLKQTCHNFLFSLLEETSTYCHYLLKQSFLQIPFKIFLSWFWNLPRREKSVARPSSHPYGFTNYELRISGYQLKVHKFFWQWDGVLILPKLSH